MPFYISCCQRCQRIYCKKGSFGYTSSSNNSAPLNTALFRLVFREKLPKSLFSALLSKIYKQCSLDLFSIAEFQSKYIYKCYIAALIRQKCLKEAFQRDNFQVCNIRSQMLYADTRMQLTFALQVVWHEYLISFYLKVRLLVLLLSYRVHWESPGQHLAR